MTESPAMPQPTAFKDHFSGHAASYTLFRPSYPKDLFAFLATQAPARGRAWDCATGNGQAAVDLAEQFDEVVATDASQRQIDHARQHPRVRYQVAPAETVPIADASVDLTTVAQALHWFDLPRFYAEVRRVSRPGAVLAVWTYNLLRLDPELDRLIDVLYYETVGPYWPAERHHVDTEYRELPFPFPELPHPDFAMTATWGLDQLLGYLATWSGVQRCRQQTGLDAVAEAAPALSAAWGDPAASRLVRWPLAVRLGRVDGNS